MSKGLDVSGIAAAMDKALAAVESFAPIAAKIDLIAPVATIAISAAHIGRNIIERAESGAVVLTTHDRAKIEASLQGLQAMNDKLNEAVKAS